MNTCMFPQLHGFHMDLMMLKSLGYKLDNVSSLKTKSRGSEEHRGCLVVLAESCRRLDPSGRPPSARASNFFSLIPYSCHILIFPLFVTSVNILISVLITGGLI